MEIMKKKNYAWILSLFFLTMSIGAFAQNKTNESGKVIKLNKEEFLTKVFNYEKNSQEWKYEGNKPAIIDFYADWCGPCRKVAPVLEELAKEYAGKIVIYKVDTEKDKELAQKFGIQSLPSLLFVPMNGKPQMAVGAIPKEDLKKAIDEFLLGVDKK